MLPAPIQGVRVHGKKILDFRGANLGWAMTRSPIFTGFCA
jgi:hypothetical protein